MRNVARRRSAFHLALLLALLFSFAGPTFRPAPALADHTPNPTSVTLAGSLDSEIGCSGDWQPDCAAAHLTYEAGDDVWQGSWSLPAGNWEYKAALNDGWAENYGQGGVRDGANISLSLASPTAVKFYYDHKTHWVTDNQNSVIATVPGSFQSALGCPGDWDPGCLRSWLEDPDGDDIYTFETAALPAGSYEAKAAINESWAENYGQGGVRDGDNIPFTVPFAGARVTFRYNPSTHVLSILSGHGHDNNVEYFGLGHDSQDTLYRVPFGAILPDTPLILRFRTYANDVTGVRVRFFDTVAGGQFFLDMIRAARGVSCYDPAQPGESCDFWQTTYTPAAPTTLYYRFIVNDGATTAYYADDSMRDGGWGQAMPTAVDESYAVTVFDPAFQPIPWMRDAVIYQVFPDRFRNGDPHNDPGTSEPRYGYPPNPDDQIINKSWGDLPEGYCRFYANPATPCAEGPRGRDYFGGDLKGLRQKLKYLQDLGVTAIYLNPIFESASNHGYDTQDYYSIDHFFGRVADFKALVDDAHSRGIRIILDGVFNHVSSDSAYFDRYGHFAAVGACESVASPYRDWFYFHDVPASTGPCAGSAGANSATYDAWFGFDSLPVFNKNNPQVRNLVYATDDAIARHWLALGADGWRLDVMGDGSFPADYWQGFRQAVKDQNPAAPIIGELWKKDETLAKVHGDQADTTMNYRFRNAVLGFFGTVDNKGFPDDGQSNQPPSVFVRKLTSIREDYPDATYYTLMNLMDSHDTQRILWSLTPGQNNREDKEDDAANLAQGKRLLRLAVVVQMTLPGAPTIYYGDEVGLTGDDDPDDRRPFPWTDIRQQQGKWPNGAGGDLDLLQFYRALIGLRASHAALREGQLTFLLADDSNRTLAYLIRTESEGVLVALNRNTTPQTLSINLAGRLPGDALFTDSLQTVSDVAAAHGVLSLTLPPLSAAVLVPAAGQDLAAPEAPVNLRATAGNARVDLSWDAVGDAAIYNLYRSPVTGGGWTRVATAGGNAYADTSVVNGQRYYYVVRAADAAGNEGRASGEAAATPFFPIGYAVLQWPKTINHTLGVAPTETIYGQVYVAGYTDASPRGDPAGILAQVGFGPQGSDPATWTTWKGMAFNAGCSCGNNYEYLANLRPEATGTFDLLVRFSTDGGLNWAYGDQDGYVPGSNPGTNQPGVLTVLPNPDTTPPLAPTNLAIVNSAASFLTLSWDAVGDAAEYWLYRHDPGGAFGTPLVKLPGSTTVYMDTSVTTGVTYTYAVRAVDAALNLSPNSNEASGTPMPRNVAVTFEVTVPATTPGTATVYIVGNQAQICNWCNPHTVALTLGGDGKWRITLNFLENTSVEYKYTLGSWDFVEKGPVCNEINNRQVLVSGNAPTQLVQDTVANWRNVSPCGN